jgi:hypothetical protein
LSVAKSGIFVAIAVPAFALLKPGYGLSAFPIIAKVATLDADG